MGDRILVLNGRSYRTVVDGLGEIVYSPAEFIKDPGKFKLVLFTGGSDVDPSFYGDTSPKHVCWSNVARDRQEKHIFDIANSYGLLMTGICRGIQFLNVMAGGKLMHHLDGHEGTIHTMQLVTGEQFYVNSFHHQMILPANNAKVVGFADPAESSRYIGFGDEKVRYRGREIEAAIFPDSYAFGVQYHPEMIPERFEAYNFYRLMIENALNLPWEDFEKAYTKGSKDVKLLEVREHSGTVGG